jgi:hypothetical protein
MLIIAYLLTGISALLGLGVGVLGCMLSSMFISGISSSDKLGGWIMLLISLLYIAHPVVAVHLIKSNAMGWCYLYDFVFIAISIGLCIFMLTAIEAVARP